MRRSLPTLSAFALVLAVVAACKPPEASDRWLRTEAPILTIGQSTASLLPACEPDVSASSRDTSSVPKREVSVRTKCAASQ
jgi:hypothetical protein